jgi:ribosomal protein L14
MLFKETILVVNDNTGIIKAKLICHFTGNYAKAGSLVFLARKKLKKGFVMAEKKKLGLVVGTRFGTRRLSGIKVQHSKNIVLILQDRTSFLGARFHGAFFSEIKNSEFVKLGLSSRYFI